jgi:hypothetical protein
MKPKNSAGAVRLQLVQRSAWLRTSTTHPVFVLPVETRKGKDEEWPDSRADGEAEAEAEDA